MSDRRKRRYPSTDSDSDDYIRWKISKLKKRLRKNKGSGSQSPSSVSKSTQNQSHQDLITSPELSDSEDDDVPLSVFAANEAAGPSDAVTTEEASTLDASILALLGNEQPPPELLGPNIHADLASRWSYVLSNGLSEEVVNALTKKYPPAGNCPLLKGPRVNPEVASVINDQVSRRDSNLIGLQNQIGTALSALGRLATALLSDEGGAKHSYIEFTSDASRLLLDFHHKYSVIRRDLLMLNLRKDLKETLTNVSADGWLFGNNLGERIKASQDIEKTGLNLKPAKAPKSNTTFKQSAKQIPVNSYRPPRRALKGASGSGRQSKFTNPSQSFQQKAYPTQRRTTDQDRRRRREGRSNYKRTQ